MRYRLRTLITASAATALLLGGAGPGHATPHLVTADQPSITSQATTYHAEDLFTGMMLGYGPVAEAHPEVVLGTLDGVAPEHRAAFAAELINAVNQLDPTFLGQFAADLTSGNRALVDRAIQDGQAMVDRALVEVMGATVTKPTSDESGTCVYLIVWIVVASHVNAAAVANAAVTVNVGVNVNAVYNVNQFWNVSLEQDHSTQLAYEKWVDQVAESLA